MLRVSALSEQLPDLCPASFSSSAKSFSTCKIELDPHLFAMPFIAALSVSHSCAFSLPMISSKIFSAVLQQSFKVPILREPSKVSRLLSGSRQASKTSAFKDLPAPVRHDSLQDFNLSEFGLVLRACMAGTCVLCIRL
jgi:hypothetical protein